MLTPMRKHAIDDIIRILVAKYKAATESSFYTSRIFITNLSQKLIEKHIIQYRFEIGLEEIKEYLNRLPEAHTESYNIFADSARDQYNGVSTEIILMLIGKDYNDVIDYFNN